MSKVLTKRWKEHFDQPKFFLPKEQTNFEFKIYLENEFKPIFFGQSQSKHLGFHFDQSHYLVGLIDAYMQLYQLNAGNTSKVQIDSRELDYYLRDRNTVSSYEGHEGIEALVASLNNALNDFMSLSREESYTELSTAQKISKIKLVLEEFFNKKFQSSGKQAHLVDVQDDMIVVNVEGSMHCDLDKDLEYMQNLLQDKLNHYDINVIPEC